MRISNRENKILMNQKQEMEKELEANKVKCCLHTSKCTGLKKEVKLSMYRPLGLQKVEAPRISRQSVHEGGKVVSPMHWPPLRPRGYPWYSFLLRGWVDPRDIVRPEGLSV
jgi:hypothetical protein